jgi:hypothetical protein
VHRYSGCLVYGSAKVKYGTSSHNTSSICRTSSASCRQGAVISNDGRILAQGWPRPLVAVSANPSRMPPSFADSKTMRYRGHSLLSRLDMPVRGGAAGAVRPAIAASTPRIGAADH